MNKPYASYFISIRGDDATLNKVDQYLLNANIVPDYIDVSSENVGETLYEVPNGSIPRWADVDEVFAKLSETFPSLSITVQENCEEPVFPGRTITFAGGKKSDERYGRILSPEDYDWVTITKLTAALRANDMDALADFITGLKLA